MKFCYSPLLSLLLIAATVRGQLPQTPQAPPSPNVFAFTQMTKIPVTYFTGLPSMQINLSQTNYKTSAIKVDLSYNASGFRPDQHPSWVGTGWNLSVGGMITRTVNGLPDEFRYTMYDQVHPGNSTDYNTGWISYQDGTNVYPYGLNFLSRGAYHWVDKKFTSGIPHEWVKYPWPFKYHGSYMGVSCNTTTRYYNFHSIPTEEEAEYLGTLDVQRDEYTFNMFGYAGKFYFKDNDEIVVVSDKKFLASHITGLAPIPSTLLQPNSDPQAGATCLQWMLGMSPYDVSGYYPHSLKGFTLTAEDGTIFYFGNHEEEDDAIEYSIGENYKLGTPGFGEQNYTDQWIANSWYLTGVQFPDGRGIHYGYERGEYVRNIYNAEQSITVVQNAPPGAGCGNANSVAPLPAQLAASKITSPVYLQKVWGDLVEMTFSYSNTGESNLLTANAVQNFKWKKLDTITVKDYDGLAFKWVFTYDALSTWSQRLFLQKIERLDPNNVTTGERYLFEYNSHLTLPNYNAAANDHWGFWNGTTSTSVYGYTNAQLDALRAPSLTHTTAGVLKKVIYPTNGYRIFNYELNQFRKKVKAERMNGVDSLSSNQFTGGLRIASIITVDSVTQQADTIRYFYVSDYNPSLTFTQNAALPSSGVRNIYDYVYHWADVIGSFYAPYPTCLQNLKFQISSAQPLAALQDDYHIGYTMVVEVRPDSAYTVRRFTNHDNGHADDSLTESINPFESPYRHFSSRSLERGKPIFEGQYNKAGTLVQSISTDYVVVPAEAGGPAKTYLDNWTCNIMDAVSGNGQVSAWEVIPTPYIFSDRYKEYTYAYLPSKVTTRTYQENTGNYLTTVQDMEYGEPSHWQVTKQSTTGSDGKIFHQIVRFPNDYTTGTFVTSRLINSHRLTTPIEKINLFQDSAAGTLKVKGATLDEYGLNTFCSGCMAWPVNTYELKLASPITLSSMTATEPAVFSLPTTSGWTIDSRYRLKEFNKAFDQTYNIIEQHTPDGFRTRYYYGYNGQRMIASHSLTTSGTHWNPAYTSFETIPVRTWNNYYEVNTVADSDNWVLIGSRDTTMAFTGKTSFIGRARYYTTWVTSRIILAARADGPLPTMERYDPSNGTYTTIPSAGPTVLGEVDGWKILQYVYGSGGWQIAINSNGNRIDELRMGANYTGDLTHFFTFTYVNGRLTHKTNHRMEREQYEYDAIGRLLRKRDSHGNIIEQYEYKFNTPSY